MSPEIAYAYTRAHGAFTHRRTPGRSERSRARGKTAATLRRMDYGFDQLDEFDPLPKQLETEFGGQGGLCGVEIALGLMDDQWLSP